MSAARTDDLEAFPPLEWASQDPTNCSIGLTIDLVGDKWALLILRELVFGVDRFDAVQSHLGISRRTLAERLDALVSNGLVEREPITVAGQRARHRYVLTQAGLELVPVIVALREWGDRHRPDASPPPVALLHAGCGGRSASRSAASTGTTSRRPRISGSPAVPAPWPSSRRGEPPLSLEDPSSS